MEVRRDAFAAAGASSGGPALSVVSPCYDEEAGIESFYERMSRACEAEVGGSFELVLVNDGSRDGTWAKLRQLAARDERVVAINLARNYGHQIALTAGLQYCRGQRVLVIDADLQDPPELLPAMMRKMDEGNDVVFGLRHRRAGETPFKLASAAAFYRTLRRLVDIDIPLDTGDFRLMRRRAVLALNAMPEQHRFIRGMVSWIGLRQCGIAYDRDQRFAGRTNYSLGKMAKLAIDAITGFSVVPLRAASVLGFIFGILSALMVTYTIGGWLLGATIQGWASLTTIVLILGSVQLLVLGVIGEYLGRLYMEAKRRPLFLVDEILARQRERTADEPESVLPHERLNTS